MSDKMTKQDVADKVDWEGGIPQAMFWGLKSEDIGDEELRKAWAEAEPFLEKLAAIDALLPEVEPDDELWAGEDAGYL